MKFFCLEVRGDFACSSGGKWLDMTGLARQ